MAIGILDPETLKGLIVLVLLILFGSGAGFKIINKYLKRVTER